MEKMTDAQAAEFLRLINALLAGPEEYQAHLSSLKKLLKQVYSHEPKTLGELIKSDSAGTIFELPDGNTYYLCGYSNEREGLIAVRAFSSESISIMESATPIRRIF